MAVDRTKILFSTSFNLLKIAANDSATLSIPDTFNPSTFKYDINTQLLFTHNLGYIPRARVFYEPAGGQVWPIALDQFDNSNGGPGTTLPVFGTYHLTTTGLYVDVKNVSGITAAVKFYYRVYYEQ